MGKDGSQWHHNWTPANTAAVRLKLHQAVNGTSKPGQRQQRLKDVKPTAGSFLPLPPAIARKPSTAKTAKPKTATVKKPKAAAQHDLTTREGRARAVAGADLSTPQGRSLVAKAQRASLAATPVSHIPGSSVKPPKTTAKPRAPRKPAKPKQPPKTTEQRVHDAVHQAAKNASGIYSGHSVTVADARDTATLAGVSPADFDRTLMKLHDSGTVMVTSSNASMLLTPRQRAGGIKFGGVNNQIISLG